MVTVKINGHDAGFKFNNFAIELLGSVKGISETASGFGTALIYCAYRGWCFYRQIDERLTFQDIADWVDSSINNPEIDTMIGQITADLLQSEYWKKTQSKKNEPLNQNAAA